LAIGPCFACLPQSVHPAAKLTTGSDLLSDQIGLLGSEEAGAGLASNGMREAVVGTVTRLEILRTGAAWLAALDRAFGKGATPHGLDVG
jgi:hypothetical protein